MIMTNRDILSPNKQIVDREEQEKSALPPLNDTSSTVGPSRTEKGKQNWDRKARACATGAVILFSVSLLVPLVIIRTSSPNANFSRSPRHAAVNRSRYEAERNETVVMDVDDELFRFPSVEERVFYYMGSWHTAKSPSFSLRHQHRTVGPRVKRDILPLYSLCPSFLLCDLPKIHKGENTSDLARLDPHHGWRLVGPSTASHHCYESDGRSALTTRVKYASYCPAALSFALVNPGAGAAANIGMGSSSGGRMPRQDHLILMGFGDSAKGLDLPMPAVVRSRLSERVTLRLQEEEGAVYYSQILWPFLVNRHFGPIFEHEETLRGGTPWEEKRETLLWRGSGGTNTAMSYGRQARPVVVERWYHHPDRAELDVAFSSDCMASGCGNATGMVRPAVRIPEQMDYKYLLSLEGNDVSSGLKWMLYSNSVVFMPRPVMVSWFMEDQLVPFIHYVPIKDDASDLADMVSWARKHDEECRNISRRATEYVKRFVLTDRADKENEAIMGAMQRMYFGQEFGDQYRDYCVKRSNMRTMGESVM